MSARSRRPATEERALATVEMIPHQPAPGNHQTPLLAEALRTVADIPEHELLDAAYVSLSLARLTRGSATSMPCAMKALLCLIRAVGCPLPAPGGRAGA